MTVQARCPTSPPTPILTRVVCWAGWISSPIRSRGRLLMAPRVLRRSPHRERRDGSLGRPSSQRGLRRWTATPWSSMTPTRTRRPAMRSAITSRKGVSRRSCRRQPARTPAASARSGRCPRCSGLSAAPTRKHMRRRRRQAGSTTSPSTATLASRQYSSRPCALWRRDAGGRDARMVGGKVNLPTSVLVQSPPGAAGYGLKLFW